MARVFVSHAGEDIELADHVCGWLTDDRHDVFLDRDVQVGIIVGENWESRLFERLHWADAVVCIVTTAYLRSIWCTAELTTALNRGSRILPIEGEPGVRHPLLARVQESGVARDPERARASLREALSQLDAAGGQAWEDGRNPFPGLRAFSTDMHRVFFGRSLDVSRLHDMLRTPTTGSDNGMFTVIGPSGCGKSSMVRAGLLPALANDDNFWVLPVVMPGNDPIAAISRSLVQAFAQLGQMLEIENVREAILGEHPTDIMYRLLSAAPEPTQRRRLVITIDQFEEVLTGCDAAGRAGFAAILRAAINGPAAVVATLRPEFLDALLADPGLADLRPRPLLVAPLSPGALSDVIEGPAELAGIPIDPGLADRMVSETGTGEALPLLAFVLNQLVTESPSPVQLTRRAYEALGGVQGALASQAALALADATRANSRTTADVMAALLRLVTVDEHNKPIRLRLQLRDTTPGEQDLYRPFVERRLLVLDTEDGVDTVGVAHEAFLTAWSPLRAAIASDAARLRARVSVEQAARGWDERGRLNQRLWAQGQLAAALHDLRVPPRTSAQSVATQSVDLTPTAREFLTLSIRTDRRRRRRATTILTTLLIVAVATGIAAYLGQRSAFEQREQAEINGQLATAQRNIATARQLSAKGDGLIQTDSIEGIKLLLGADALNPDPQVQSDLFKTMVNSHLQYQLGQVASDTKSVAFSPDGKMLASGSRDGSVTLWQLGTGSRPVVLGAPLAGYSGSVNAVSFSPTGHILATAGTDGTAALWDISDPKRPSRLGGPMTGQHDAISSANFSPDGRMLELSSADGTVLLWNISTPDSPTLAGTLPASVSDPAPVSSAVFGSGGKVLITGDAEGSVTIWDIGKPSQPGKISSFSTVQVTGLDLSSDNHTLAVAGVQGTSGAVVLWNVLDVRHPQQLGHPTPSNPANSFLLSVDFSPDGKHLVGGTSRGTVDLWDVADHGIVASETPWSGRSGNVQAVRFSPDGTTVASAGPGGPLMWRVADQWKVLANLYAELPLTTAAVAFSPSGRFLVAGLTAGSLAVWDMATPAHPSLTQNVVVGGPPIDALAFRADGQELASADSSGTVLLWSVGSDGHLRKIGGPMKNSVDGRGSVAFGAAGNVLAVGSRTIAPNLWDINQPNRPRLLGSVSNDVGGEVQTVSFGLGGSVLATGTNNGSAYLWNIADVSHANQVGAPLSSSPASITALAFDDPDRLLVTGDSDGTLVWRDLSDLQHPRQIGAPVNAHAGKIDSVLMTRDGHLLMSAGADDSLKIFDLGDASSPVLVQDLTVREGSDPTSLALAPNGRFLAFTDDGRAGVLDLSALLTLRSNVIARACELTDGGLDQTDWAVEAPGTGYLSGCH